MGPQGPPGRPPSPKMAATPRVSMVMEPENPAVPGFAMRYASFDDAVSFLINCFLPAGGLEDEENRFPYIFLLMHEWFVTSEKLARCLVEHYVTSNTQHRCLPPCNHTLQHSAHCPAYKHKAQVCQVFGYWIQKFPRHFEAAGVSSILLMFQSRLRQEGNPRLAEVVNMSRLPSSRDWARCVSVRHPLAKHTRKVSLVFDHLEPRELADHLTYLEHKVMRRITVSAPLLLLNTVATMSNCCNVSTMPVPFNFVWCLFMLCYL